LQWHDFVTILTDFGNTYIAPQEIATMAWTSNSRCQIALKSGKFVYAKQSCNEVHDGLSFANRFSLEAAGTLHEQGLTRMGKAGQAG
jgi:hypothetical protein